MRDTASAPDTMMPDAGDSTGQPAIHPFIFNQHHLNEYQENILKGIELVRKRMAASDGPFTGILPHELASRFEGIDLDQPFADLNDALAEVERLYLNDAVYFHHPQYVAHLNCPVVMPAILAEVILTSINSSLDTWDQSAGGTFIEQKLIDWTAGKVGLGDQADGIFTSGGTQSNLMALLLARDRHCAETGAGWDARTAGLPDDFHKLRIFASEASHFSVQKSAAILGLGYDAVIPVRCDARFRMDVPALEREIRGCRAQGLIPMAVVATAGTTDFGSIDPLAEIAALCRTHGLWMHADAAYGCGLLASSRHRDRLWGIQHADSVTVDYHKSFFQPVSCSAFLVKDRRHLSLVTCHAEYLNPTSQLREGTPNQVNKSLQTTRRFDALKLWLSLRTVGAGRIGEAFDRLIDLARQTYWLLLAEETLEVIHQPELSTLVFRYRPVQDCPAPEIDAANAYIRKALFRSGKAVVAGTKVGNRRYLKFTLLNPTATLNDLQAVIALIKHHGAHYFAREAQRQPAPVTVDDGVDDGEPAASESLVTEAGHE